MGWGEVLKGLLEAFAKLVRDIPVWAKVVLVFGIFALLAYGVVVNLDQLVVYDIEILEQPRSGVGAPYLVEHKTTGRQSETDRAGRVKLILQAGPLEGQENDIVIRKSVVNVGEEPPRIRYGFRSKAWRSQMLSLTLTCDFRGKACQLEKTGQFEDVEEAPRSAARGLDSCLQAGVSPGGPSQARASRTPSRVSRSGCRSRLSPPSREWRQTTGTRRSA